MKKDDEDYIIMTYNAKRKEWEVRLFCGGHLISHYHYKENDGLGFIAGLTHNMNCIRASGNDNEVLNRGKNK
jgi:hypothetical protein